MPLGPMELILIVLAVTLIFGANKVPDLMRAFGRGLREFKTEVNDLQQGIVMEPVRPVCSSADQGTPENARTGAHASLD